MTLYERLQVPADATPAEIRDAYRRQARLHHPDRAEHDASTMAAINAAYHVLRDPARRAVYDAELRALRSSARPPAPAGATVSPMSSSTPTPTSMPPWDTTPARIPWKLMAVMATAGATVVLVGAALYEPAAEPPPDNLLEPGSCVVIEGDGDTREVACDGTEEFVVRAVVPFGDPCPEGIAGYRDGQGRGRACVVPAS